MMATSTNMSPCNGEMENGFCKENLSDIEENQEESDQSSQLNIGKPPRNITGMRHCISQATLAGTSVLESTTQIVPLKSSSRDDSGYVPIFRSGSYSEIGPKPNMEDEHICIDDLCKHIGASKGLPSPGAFYGVFDGHGGVDAASFTQKNLLSFIVEDSHFPSMVKRAIRNAFVKADNALADTKSLDSTSGTTALTALILGRTMLIANAGDSRAVLGKRGRAIELSKDHKPNTTSEKLRIEKLGGVIYDGYLNGQLSVARALGDWHIKGPKGSKGPLSSEPELEEVVLSEEDEFLIMACDGLWDVMSSQYAVTIVRKELMLHNDPERCSRELVREALKRNTCDNLTVLVVCFSSDPPPRIEIPRTQRRRSISAEGLDLLKGVLSDI
ncbi:probable protein phosphatase 2C 47 [Lycium barbarum]|uniref:probable protein phosphatase 2C 47 n=1 Tax=Lycium barbarum TaxID=112863 RepID=UPI00293E7966|nr:probable protein phosphatase 2C 47 [Lycium barbarum]